MLNEPHLCDMAKYHISEVAFYVQNILSDFMCKMPQQSVAF